MLQAYNCELKMRLKSTEQQSKFEMDRFHQLAVEAIQLRDKHICLFGFRAGTDTGSASNRPDPLSVCSVAKFHELMVRRCLVHIQVLSACPHVGLLVSYDCAIMTIFQLECTSADTSAVRRPSVL